MHTQGTPASFITRLAQATCTWSERWVPDPFAIVALVVAAVVIFALGAGIAPITVARTFGDGFWNLIPFTMQMTFIVIGGYVVADSPPVARLIQRVAAIPKSGRAAIVQVALCSMLLSLIHWGLSLVVASLLVRAIAKRTELGMDYRAASAAAYLGNGSVWALGLSSSAAQLQANPASMPAGLLAVTGVIPFSETIFLWQSLTLAAILIVLTAWTAWVIAPAPDKAQTAEIMGVDLHSSSARTLSRPTKPGEWLEYSPGVSLFIGALAAIWIVDQLMAKGFLPTIANLNTYNFIFLMVGLVLHWRPRHFLDSAARSLSSVGGILIQFPLLGAISMMITGAKNAQGETLSQILSGVFSDLAAGPAFAFVVGIYSAFLGLLIPSNGGKWVIEAPYVMQAAKDMEYHLGWAVQIFNAAQSLPNLINPFWMLPVLGIVGLKARHLIGFTFVHLIVNLPVVLILVWLLGMTLTYHPPIMP